jgi:hypothetical protein
MPPSATAIPAAVACTAPQAPSARPTCSRGALRIVAVSVPWPKSPAPSPASPVPATKSAGWPSGPGRDDGGEGRNARQRAPPRHVDRIPPVQQHPRGDGEADEPAKRQHRGQPRGHGHRQVQHLPAIGLQQDIGHAEAHGAERDHDQQAHRRAPAHEKPPGVDELGMGLGLHACGAGAVARFLLPQGHQVQRDGHHRGALHHLHQLAGRVVVQERAEDQRGGDHAHQQHHIHQPDDLGLVLDRHEVGGQREAHGLHRVHARPDQQEGERGAGIADPERRIGRLLVARQHQQREGHDREAAELQHRALPDVGHAAPAERGFVDVGAVADQRAERREQKRQRNHHATSVAGTSSSTIITRLSVPTSSTSAMPTVTWNSDRRSRRDSGRSRSPHPRRACSAVRSGGSCEARSHGC